MNIEDITLKQIREIQGLAGSNQSNQNHPMIGRRCLVRTYSAGILERGKVKKMTKIKEPKPKKVKND